MQVPVSKPAICVSPYSVHLFTKVDGCPFVWPYHSGHVSTCQVGVLLAFVYTIPMSFEPLSLEEQSIIPIALGPEPAPVRVERADAQENRARILAAAATLFREQGVANVNMVDIARKAEVGQGTLYRRFGSKGELCLALLDTQMRDFQDQTLQQLRAMALDAAPFRQQLAWFIEAWIGFQAHHSLLLCAVSQDYQVEAHPQSPPFRWQRMTVHALLHRAAAAGELANDVDIPFTADAILTLLQPDILRLQQEIGGYPSARMIAGIQRLLQGLRR